MIVLDCVWFSFELCLFILFQIYYMNDGERWIHLADYVLRHYWWEYHNVDWHLISSFGIVLKLNIKLKKKMEMITNLKKLLIVKQILLVGTRGNVTKTVKRIWILMLGCKWLKEAYLNIIFESEVKDVIVRGKVISVMNTTSMVVKLKPEKKIQTWTEILVQS